MAGGGSEEEEAQARPTTPERPRFLRAMPFAVR